MNTIDAKACRKLKCKCEDGLIDCYGTLKTHSHDIASNICIMALWIPSLLAFELSQVLSLSGEVFTIHIPRRSWWSHCLMTYPEDPQ